MTTPETTPLKINLKKDEKLEITWSDGKVCTYTISLLRTMCPCALCRNIREGDKGEKKPAAAPAAEPGKKRTMGLSVLPGNFTKPLAATGAELVGNYALQIHWTDEHSSGIYSFAYLRSICP